MNFFCNILKKSKIPFDALIIASMFKDEGYNVSSVLPPFCGIVTGNAIHDCS